MTIQQARALFNEARRLDVKISVDAPAANNDRQLENMINFCGRALEAIEAIKNNIGKPNNGGTIRLIIEVLEAEEDTNAGKTEAAERKWVHHNDDCNDWLVCPVCEYGDEGEVPWDKRTPYCPHCGAKLIGGVIDYYDFARQYTTDKHGKA